jgi:hypothetical protein
MNKKPTLCIVAGEKKEKEQRCEVKEELLYNTIKSYVK